LGKTEKERNDREQKSTSGLGDVKLLRFRFYQRIFVGKEVRQVLYLPEEQGQGLVEYALILVLVAIVVIAILLLLGPQIGNIFSRVTSALFDLPT